MAKPNESYVSFGSTSFDNHTSTTSVKKVEQDSYTVCCPCSAFSWFNDWWNVAHYHQRFIINIVEKTIFHVVIVILVLVDCALVVGELMLDFIYLNQKCGNKTRSSEHDSDKKNHKLELGIEVLHYGSIILLAVFVFEVLVKIYSFGKKWWNFREKKMEWLDAIIVIVSFVIDIYFLKQPNAIAEISLLFIAFRLWRIIRIINSVAQSIRTQDESVKKHLANDYLQVIELLLNVLTKKTEVALELRGDLTSTNYDKMIDKYNSIDKLCRSILTHCHKPSSRNAVTDIAQNLQDVLEEIRQTSAALSFSGRT